MATPAVAPRARPPGSGRATRPEPARSPARGGRAATVPLEQRTDLERLASRWQIALDAAHRALDAAAVSLLAPELGAGWRRLARERQQTADVLALAARTTGAPVPWLSPVPVTPELLGLSASTRACLFDLDGVLTDSAALHARAWGMVFDEFLLRLSDKTGWHFIPFDRDEDYHRWIEGRTRLDGVHAFLESRGIRVPAGAAGDPRDDDTAHALATRKGELVARELRERGVTATAGARRYLEAAGRAGLQRSVISASASTGRMLGYAGLSDVVDDRIDADVIRCERLMSPPAPDVPLAACRRLGVPPGEVVLLTHSAGGAAAGRAAGVSVVGVSDSAHAGRLGVEHVVPSLASLLDGRLAAASGGPVRR